VVRCTSVAAGLPGVVCGDVFGALDHRRAQSRGDIIATLEGHNSMIKISTGSVAAPPPTAAPRFLASKARLDTRLLTLFRSQAIRRRLREQPKLNLGVIAARAQLELATATERGASFDGRGVHQQLVAGLPGQALFIAAALAFESLAEALPYFDLSIKTAWQKLDHGLSRSESEQALRLGRAAALAAELFGSAEAGRRYLHTPHFALGGSTPLELLKTAEGEQLVLTELQTQAAGGPV
jgi:putative toxin-antitoxin system antitoxin component (TIGR02293 family)